MLHHLYGILERPPSTSRIPDAGVDDRPVLARRVGRFVVLSTLVDGTARRTARAVGQHHDVLAAVTTTAPFLPLPYGVIVPSGALDAWLAVRAAAVRAGLRLVRGRVEMHVRVLALHFGAADRAALCALADHVAAASGLAQWRSRIAGHGGNATITLAFLVPRADVATFLARIAPLASRAGDIAVVPTGPWPPLTFVPALDLGTGAAQGAVAVPHAV